MVISNHLSTEDYDVCAKSSHSLPKLPSEKRGRISGEDRISNLPQPLKHHILSKLPSEDAMRTMILSKAWKDDWLTSPSLDFATEKLDRYLKDTQLRDKFLYFANRILKRRNDLNCWTIERLHLFLPAPPEFRRTHSENQGDKLLCYAVTKYVIYELKLSSYSTPCKYELSKAVIQYAHSLTCLELDRLKLDQQTLAILAVKCPLLNSLKLRFCDFSDMKVRIFGFHRLVDLSLIGTPTRMEGDDVRVEIIDAPSLEEFRLSGLGTKSPSIDVISDTACKGLKHMDLTNASFDRSSLNRVLSFFPNLQHLNLSCHFHCHQRLDICIPSLKHLELRLQILLEQLHIDAPNLTDIAFTFLALNAVPKIFSYNAAAFNPEKVTIDISSCNTRFERLLQDSQFNRFYGQLVWFPRHLIARISIYDPDTLPCNRGLHSPAHDFKHVVLTFEVWDLCFCWLEPARSYVLFTALLDPALRLFPNLRTCIILQRNHGREPELIKLKLEFKYKGSEVRGCWQERLHEVKIGNIQGSNMHLTPLNNYFDKAIKANKRVGNGNETNDNVKALRVISLTAIVAEKLVSSPFKGRSKGLFVRQCSL